MTAIMDGAKDIKCSEFGDAIIEWMDKTVPAAAKVESQRSKVSKKVVAKKPAAKKVTAKKKVAVKKPMKKSAIKKKSKK